MRLRQHAIPEIQGLKIGLDIFTYKDTDYLVLVDYLTDFIDFEKLQNLSSESVIDICKRSVARFGIPDDVQAVQCGYTLAAKWQNGGTHKLGE